MIFILYLKMIIVGKPNRDLTIANHAIILSYGGMTTGR